jgi:hypothetical protein
MTTAIQHLTRSTTVIRRPTVIAVAVASVLAVNLLLFVLGRACGGAFTYTQGGKSTRVDAVAVAVMSVVPTMIGLALVAWLSRRWPVLNAIAKIIAPALAIATIGLMTLPARFDTTSKLFLAAMHLTLIPAALLALRALTPQRAECE